MVGEHPPAVQGSGNGQHNGIAGPYYILFGEKMAVYQDLLKKELRREMGKLLTSLTPEQYQFF